MSSFAPPFVLPDISPSRGEIALLSLPSPNINAVKEELSAELPISPLEGEMPSFGKEGRTEGAATERNVDDCHPDPPHELG
ncbi:MAG: hypothetical protein EOS11_33630 [Mesorhizobium sp.]|nr:MAG: hypothetical protein EOS10_25870 [Mesorhizobium sp.]RWO35740.1 MAG: hypothetical protein EOS11_33630 [Mesorhizobium sp.]TIN75830.1 MAG: hypothetical protein E5Y09_25340 [Mesorhizobium sp.]